MKPIKLAPDLEKALLHGVINGHCAPEILNPEELSKKGKAIHGAIDALSKKGAKPPYKLRALSLAAVHLCGMERVDVEAYIDGLKAFDAGPETSSILRTVREKATLVNLVNRAGQQLADGDIRLSDLRALVEHPSHGTPLKSVSSSIGKKWKKPPRGLEIRCLPHISELTRGLQGIWVIAGEPGAGKSTLAWQIGLDVAPVWPVIYYDLDGTGFEYFLDHTRIIYDDSLIRAKRATKNIFFRSSIASFDEDLSATPSPALLVIDSPQTLPLGVRFSKETLDNWIRRFKELTNKGYTVLMTSEKARSQYGEANMGGFKESGDIEYAATMAAHLLAYDGDPEGPLKFICIKNRHGRKKGHIIDLERDTKKTYWWREVEPIEDDSEPPQRGRRRE